MLFPAETEEEEMLGVLFDPGWANRVGLGPSGRVLHGVCDPA